MDIITITVCFVKLVIQHPFVINAFCADTVPFSAMQYFTHCPETEFNTVISLYTKQLRNSDSNVLAFCTFAIVLS